jgi:hypothetical protein
VVRIVQSNKGYFAQLSSLPDPKLAEVDAGSPGAHLLIQDEVLHLAGHDSGFTAEPNRRYHVRILRQRQRLTMFVDGEQLLSARIHRLDAPILVFSARGPVGASVFIDNVQVRAPRDVGRLAEARRLSGLGEYDQAVAVWRELFVDEPDNSRHRKIAARVLPDEATDRLWEALPADLRPAWAAASGRPLTAEGDFRPVDLQPQANVRLKSDFHIDDDQGLRSLPQGLREFGGVQYAIGRNCLHLGSSRRQLRGVRPNSRVDEYPLTVTGLVAGGQFQRLHLLHGVGYGNSGEDGVPIAELGLHYADGSTATLEIVNGVHARDWWNNNDPEVSSGRVVWTVEEDPTEGLGYARRLYHSVWDNPHPERTLASIDFVAKETVAASFCVAITLEE